MKSAAYNLLLFTIVTVSSCSGSGGDDASPVYEVPVAISVFPDDGTSDGGDTITIHGTNVGVADITIGGLAPTSISVMDDDTVQCETPAHAEGSVDVVLNLNGDDVTFEDMYEYFDPPAITDINPASGPWGGGTLVTITGTDFSEVNSVVIGGESYTVTILNDTTVTVTTNATAPGAYNVVVDSPYGTSTSVGGYTYLP